MTFTRDFFEEFTDNVDGAIYFAHISKLKPSGLDTMRLKLLGLPDFLLHDVLYLPQLRRNLMSLVHIRQRGHSIHMFDGKVEVRKASDHSLVMTRIEEERLLKLQGNNKSYIASIKKELRKGFEMADFGYVHYYLEFEDATKYRQLVGSLNYLTTTRPNISFVVGILSRFTQKPCEGHWSAAKRVLKYLKGTQDFGLKYTQVGTFRLIGYSDSDFDGNKETRVSTYGYAMSLGSGVVSWRSRKQSVPADSTTEAEYVAVAEATKEIVWFKKILEDLQVNQVHSTPLMIDNTSTTKLAKNPKFHDRTKHINTKYHLIRHHVEAKTIHLRHCSTNEQIANIFTKALGREKLERFRTMLGITNIPSN
eukprot:PITA_14343